MSLSSVTSKAVDVVQFRHRCKEASQHIVNALDSDKSGASRSRWPLTGGGGEFREEEGRGNAGAMQQMRHIPFPMSLVELHQNRSIDHWRMGIFSEIYRVWVVLEHQLFMWNYMKEDGRDVVEVETPLNERIYGVGLSKPPAGVFNENVRYLLVTVTPSYVLIHQVVYTTDDPQDEVRFVPTDYVAPSEGLCGAEVQTGLRPLSVLVSSTIDGRIFLCGQDAAVHEFEISAPDTWNLWGQGKCRKRKFQSLSVTQIPALFVPASLKKVIYGEDTIICIEVDNDRNFLYTLNDNSQVTVYSIEKRGIFASDAPLVAAKDFRTNGATKIVALSVVAPESKLSAGVRERSHTPVLIACDHNGALHSWAMQLGRAYGGDLRWLGKMMPGSSGAQGGHMPADMRVNMCHYRGDLVLMAHDGTMDSMSQQQQAGPVGQHPNDAVLHCVHATGYDANDASQLNSGYQRSQAPQYVLSRHDLKTGGGVQALAEVPTDLIVPRPYREFVKAELDLQLPEMASQPTLSCAISDKDRDASRWVLVLTKAGLHCFIKMRPIEQLSNRLGGPSFLEALRHPPVSNFSETDIYTMCLQLACGNGPAGSASATVKDNAKNLWRRGWSGEGGKKFWVGLKGKESHEQVVPAGGGGANATGMFGSTTSKTMLYVTDRHSALALYIARLLRPIYHKTMSEITRDLYKQHVLRHLKQKLALLTGFLELEPDLEHPEGIDPRDLQLHGLHGLQKKDEEKVEMIKLYMFAKRCEEACERLQSEAHRYHSRIGTAQVKQKWDDWEKLQFHDLVLEERGQQLFFDVHKHLILHELRDRDAEEVRTLLHLPAAAGDNAALCQQPTFWGTWAQRRMEAERKVQDARMLVDQGNKFQARKSISSAFDDYRLLAQQDPTYDEESLRLQCGHLVDDKFEFFECFKFCAELCMVRMAALASMDGNRQKEVEFCRKVLLQLVMYLYYEPTGPGVRAAPFQNLRLDIWPRGGIKLKSLDLLPLTYRDNQDRLTELRKKNAGAIAQECVQICRSQVLAFILAPKHESQIYSQLHQEIYMWFIMVGFDGTDQLPALRPGLFDINDYSVPGQKEKRVQPRSLESFLKQVSTECTQMVDLKKIVETIGTFYVKKDQHDRAARQYWIVANRETLPIEDRVVYMEKAINTMKLHRPARSDDKYSQTDDVLSEHWASFLEIANIQKEVYENINLDADIQKRLSLAEIIKKIAEARHNDGAGGGGAGGGAQTHKRKTFAKLQLRCYNIARLPMDQKYDDDIGRLWEDVLDMQYGSFSESMREVVIMYKEYSLQDRLFPVAGPCGLIYQLERSRFQHRTDSLADDNAVFMPLCEECQRTREDLGQTYYDLISNPPDFPNSQEYGQWLLHLLGSVTALYDGWLDHIGELGGQQGSSGLDQFAKHWNSKEIEYKSVLNQLGGPQQDVLKRKLANIGDRLTAGLSGTYSS